MKTTLTMVVSKSKKENFALLTSNVILILFLLDLFAEHLWTNDNEHWQYYYPAEEQLSYDDATAFCEKYGMKLFELKEHMIISGNKFDNTGNPYAFSGVIDIANERYDGGSYGLHKSGKWQCMISLKRFLSSFKIFTFS